MSEYYSADEAHELILTKEKLSLEEQEKLCNMRSRIKILMIDNHELDYSIQNKLVNDKKTNVRESLADKPNLNKDIYIKLANDVEKSVKEILALNSSIDDDIINELMKDESIHYAIASSSKINKEIQFKLLESNHITTLLRLSYNEILCDEVKIKLCSNENTIPSMSRRYDLTEEMQLLIINNAKYKGYEPTEIQYIANKTLFESVINLIISQQNRSESKFALMRRFPDNLNIQKSLITEGVVNGKTRLATNSKNKDIQQELFDLKEQVIYLSLLKNQNLDKEIKKQLFELNNKEINQKIKQYKMEM